jgi:hypothetical protein
MKGSGRSQGRAQDRLRRPPCPAGPLRRRVSGSIVGWREGTRGAVATEGCLRQTDGLAAAAAAGYPRQTKGRPPPLTCLTGSTSITLVATATTRVSQCDTETRKNCQRKKERLKHFSAKVENDMEADVFFKGAKFTITSRYARLCIVNPIKKTLGNYATMVPTSFATFLFHTVTTEYTKVLKSI